MTVVFIVTAEIFTVLFQLTGLSRKKARFQVISLLTSTGFTTKESELITISKIRRKIALFIMIFGYCSTVSVVAISISTISTKRFGLDIFYTIVCVLAMLLIFSSKKIRGPFDKFIAKKATGILFGEDINYMITLETFNNNVIAEVFIHNLPEQFKDKTLYETEISNKYGIMILTIERNNQTIIRVGKDSIIKEGDNIFLYGDYNVISNVFDCSKINSDEIKSL